MKDNYLGKDETVEELLEYQINSSDDEEVVKYYMDMLKGIHRDHPNKQVQKGGTKNVVR